MTVNLVIPAPDAFGGRVTPWTQLGRVVAVLRAHNPDAPYSQIKAVAAQLLRDGLPQPGEPEVPREPRPDRFDSGAGGSEDSSATVESSESPEVGARLAEVDQRKPSRAEVEAWLARQPKRLGLTMSKSGRIPAAILVAWRQAHREEILAAMVPVEGGAPMPAEEPPAEVH